MPGHENNCSRLQIDMIGNDLLLRYWYYEHFWLPLNNFDVYLFHKEMAQKNSLVSIVPEKCVQVVLRSFIELFLQFFSGSFASSYI